MEVSASSGQPGGVGRAAAKLATMASSSASDADQGKDQALPEGWGRGTTHGVGFIFQLPVRQKHQAEAEYQREVNLARNRAAMDMIGVGAAVNDMK
jgi:hypothetical protein